MNYYNDNDPKACAWLSELIAAGEIAPGHVDERSILEIKPDDLAGFDQCHFFAGIGGWAVALQWAGWPGYRSVWTGSCPCQPFSAAGKRKGAADERHLWPVFARLIRECRPECVFGEQVEGAIGQGWLDGVCADLEAEGYAVGAHVLGAHSVGAPHRRQRLYWVADAGTPGRGALQRPGATDGRTAVEPDRRGNAGGLGNAEGGGHAGQPIRPDGEQTQRVAEADAGGWSRFDILPCRDGKARRVESGTFPLAHGVPGRVGLLRGYGNAIVPQVAAEFVRAFLQPPNAPLSRSSAEAADSAG
jgi:DNA (cytosine-5)-methyltransferase 1